MGVKQQSARTLRRVDDPGVREERVVLHAVQEAGRIRRMWKQAIFGLIASRVLRVVDTSVDVTLCYIMQSLITITLYFNSNYIFFYLWRAVTDQNRRRSFTSTELQ